jgi:putative glutamine transport system permease protein
MSPFALERWQAFFADFGQFANGFLYTLEISIGALLLAMILGVVFGSLSATRNKILRGIRGYVEVYQNTPLLIQFVVVYYGFPLLNKDLVISAFWTAIICVGLYHGAYIAEVIRSGIEGVPKGQTEAAESQGFTYGGTIRLIILPQAIRMIYPPLTNQLVNLIKNTSTVAIISGLTLCLRLNRGRQ